MNNDTGLEYESKKKKGIPQFWDNSIKFGQPFLKLHSFTINLLLLRLLFVLMGNWLATEKIYQLAL